MEKSKYYLFLDECGDQNLANFDSQFPIFVLCGIIVSEDKLKTLNTQIDALKLKFWGNKSVILHSRDIRKCEKDFKILFDANIKNEFYNAVNDIMSQNDVYVVVCCSILKESYIRQFGKLNDVYAQSLSFVLERAVFYLDSVNNGNGMQIADLIAYPIARHILDPEKHNPAFAVIEGNIYQEGDKVMGLKILP